MRTSDERIAALHARAGEIRKKDRAIKTNLARISATAACACFIIALALFMPQISSQSIAGTHNGTLPPETTPGGLYGSIFTDTAYLGYVVIGIVAFLLGAALTMFLFHLKKWQVNMDREDEIV